MGMNQEEGKQRLLDEEAGSTPLPVPSRPSAPLALSSIPCLRRILLWFGLVTTTLCYLAIRRTTLFQLRSYPETFRLAPRIPLNPGDTLVREPLADHTVTAILLHGAGDLYRNTPAAFSAFLSERYNYVKW